jgi:hypothetical protein
MSFPVGLSGHASGPYASIPAMITSPMPPSSVHVVEESPNANLKSNQESSVHHRRSECSPHILPCLPDSSELSKSHSASASKSASSLCSLAEFRDLQSQTQQLSEQLTDFELAWTPRSSVDGEGFGLLKFPDEFSDNETEWE